MNPENPTPGARVRAMAAAALASMAAGARRLEEWSARGSRPLLLGLIAVAVLAVGVFAVAFQGRQVAAWFGGDPPARMRGEGRGERFGGRPHVGHEERFEVRRWHGRAGRPDVPRPPQAPEPPAPPQPPSP